MANFVIPQCSLCERERKTEIERERGLGGRGTEGQTGSERRPERLIAPYLLPESVLGFLQLTAQRLQQHRVAQVLAGLEHIVNINNQQRFDLRSSVNNQQRFDLRSSVNNQQLFRLRSSVEEESHEFLKVDFCTPKPNVLHDKRRKETQKT